MSETPDIPPHMVETGEALEVIEAALGRTEATHD